MSMSRWFKKHEVVDYGSAIMADEEAVFVRVIYRPETRFAYFLFKPTYQHLQGDLRRHLESDLDDLLDERVLVVSARNEKSTLADRAVAGRVEQGSQELTGEAMVAKRGGIPGALLQNPFMGDILSSVEYVAHKNRPRIDRYGFWGLIVFVGFPSWQRRLGRSDVGLSGQNEVRKGIGSLFYWWYCGVHNLGIHSKGDH